ncbi:hypothetical protein G6F54_014368 [Rhizopus delemar]|nr:hypothetical protein G6F54_014368 [Rhizopus delemar]
MHFAGQLVECAARSAGVVHQQRVVQAQRRTALRQAVQRRSRVVLVARLCHGGERCGLRHIDLQADGVGAAANWPLTPPPALTTVYCWPC